MNSFLKKKIKLTFILLLTLSFLHNTSKAQQNVTLLDNLSYADNLSHITSYVSNSGNEYAIVTTEIGTSIVDVSTPTNANELLFVLGLATNAYRDAAVWNDYAYIVSEGGGGLQILDLSPLPSFVTPSTWTGGTGPSGTLSFDQAFNIFMDENGVAYLFVIGGVIMLDVNTNPTNPVILGQYVSSSVHDGYVRNDLLYTAEISTDIISIVDVSNKASPVALGSQSVSKPHSIAISDDEQFVFVSSEETNGYITAFDISNPLDIKQLGRYQSNPGSNATPHDTQVKNDFIVASYYADGVRIVDASQPKKLIEVGFYDTSPTTGSGFVGCWGVDVNLPSETILAADITQGLFTLEADYDRASFLEGIVTDASTNAPVFNVNIQIIGDNLSSDNTDFFGAYFTGTANAGTYSVLVTANGYAPQFIEVNLSSGNVENLNISLEKSVEVKAKALLEGAYSGSTMSLNLLTSNDLPLNNPYVASPWSSNNKAIPSLAFLSNNVSDWILLEARDANYNLLESQAAFVLDDGTITDIYGLNGGVHFTTLTSGNSYHFSIAHRNHLAIVSSNMLSIPNSSAYDFSNISNVLNGNEQMTNVGSSKYALAAGDCNNDGIINLEDYNIIRDNQGFSNNYTASNLNFDNSNNMDDFLIYENNKSKIAHRFLRY